MKRTPAGLKVLLGLTAVVLLAHLAVLRELPVALGLSQAGLPRAFVTRSVELAPARPPAAKSPVTPAARRKRKTPTPTPVERPEAGNALSSGEASPPASAAMEASDNPGPAQASPSQSDKTQTVASQEEAAAADPLTPAPPPPGEQPAAVSAEVLPGTVRLKYEVAASKFPYSLNAELVWQQDGQAYDARLEVSAFGQARVQTSRGQITPMGLAPIRFSDKFRSEVAAHFDREKGIVSFSANTPDVPLLAGAQDHLSALVQLAALIASHPDQYPPDSAIGFQAVGPRNAETWLFTVGHEEMLTLPGGAQRTLKLVRNPRQEFDQKVELWLAPKLGYLPARIRITEPNGDFIDQKWLASDPPD